MISPITTPQYFASPSGSSGGAGSSGQLDKDAFLKLLVAQLKHQDPNSPLQPHELAAQLAQFTTVEQLTQLNSAVQLQIEASQMAALVGQSSLAASLVGRHVEAVGDQVVVPSTGAAQVKVDILGAGGAATLTLKDDSGNVIATRSLGSVVAGNGQTLRLPADLPPGRWHYAIEVRGAGDTSSSVTTYSSGVVTAIEFKNGEIVLSAGGIEISLSSIVRIGPPPGASSGSTPTVPSREPDGGGILDVIDGVVLDMTGRR